MSIDNGINSNENWQKKDGQVFWGEIAPTEHLVQVYENDTVLIETLKKFVLGGFESGESVIIIATKEHLDLLNRELWDEGIDLVSLQLKNLYFPLNAEDMLDKFMINGWPDPDRFKQAVTNVLMNARGKNNRRVRAYGEMVAILWQQGHSGATVHLEHLWNQFCATDSFCLFCAYPKSGFTQDSNVSLQHICSMHTKMISGTEVEGSDVHYHAMQ